MQKINGYKSPYIKPNKCSFHYSVYKNKPGVYLIKENNQIVYIGMSKSCVYKAMYRHFQSWDYHKALRIVYPDTKEYTCTIYVTDHAEELEKDLIRMLKPRDNREMYETHEENMNVTVIEEYLQPTDVPF